MAPLYYTIYIIYLHRNKLKQELEERLGEFRQARSIGLGGMFGDQQLGGNFFTSFELDVQVSMIIKFQPIIYIGAFILVKR